MLWQLFCLNGKEKIAGVIYSFIILSASNKRIINLKPCIMNDEKIKLSIEEMSVVKGGNDPEPMGYANVTGTTGSANGELE